MANETKDLRERAEVEIDRLWKKLNCSKENPLTQRLYASNYSGAGLSSYTLQKHLGITVIDIMIEMGLRDTKVYQPKVIDNTYIFCKAMARKARIDDCFPNRPVCKECQYAASRQHMIINDVTLEEDKEMATMGGGYQDVMVLPYADLEGRW